MPRSRLTLGFAPLAVMMLMGDRIATADTLFYVDIFNPDPSYGSIRTLEIGQKKSQPILDTGGGLRALDVDVQGGKIYWCDSDIPGIFRCNLDGSQVEPLITTGLQFPSAIAVDAAGGKIYWGDQLTNELRRANLDGSDNQLLRNTPFHRGIVVDSANGKVYWSTSINLFKGEILRCNLDGPGLETVITSNDPEFKPNAIAIDLEGGKVYWTDYVVDCVRRGNLDGTNIQTLYQVPANLNPRGIALDLAAKKIYWGQDVDFKSPIGAIMSMGLDGAAPDTVLAPTGLANYLQLIPEGGPACPADIAGGDGIVNVADLLAVLAAWGPCPTPPALCPADIAGGDGTVSVQDLLAIIAAWGPCKP